MAEPNLPLPDLQIVIRRINPDDPRTLGFEVSARDPDLRLKFSDLGSVRLTRDPEDYVRELVRDVENLSLGSEEEREIARQRMRSKGGTLFESLFPEELRRRLWSLRTTISTLQIFSDDPHLPWELTRLRSYEGGGTLEGGFLCEEFAVTRWLRGIAETHSLPVRRLALVVPTSSGLAAAIEERQEMLALGGKERDVTEIPARYLEVTEALGEGRFDAWHFAGHGQTYSPDPSLSCIELDDQPLRPEDMGAAAGNLGSSQRPFIFFNGCHTAQGGWALAGLGGWPRALLGANAGAFIGSMWAVEDEKALSFARAFYEFFLTGTPIGEAARQARLRIRDEFPGDATWLAYTVFAHPLTTCPAATAINYVLPFTGSNPPISPPDPRPEKPRPQPVAVWRPIEGRIDVSRQCDSSWIDLPAPTDFKKGDRLQLSLGGRAARIIVRLLSEGADPNQAIGVIAGSPFEVPPSKTVEITLDEDRRRILQISVHGGSNPWGSFPLGRGNGPVELHGAACLRKS